MTGAPSLDLRESLSRGILRWGACAAAVLLAHGAIAAALSWPEPDSAGAPPAPPILIDLAEPAALEATIPDVSKLIPEPDMPEPPAPIRNPLLDMAPTPEPPPEVKIEVTIEIPPPEPPPPVDLKPPPPKVVQKPPPPKPPVVHKQTEPSRAPPSPAPPADKAAGAPSPAPAAVAQPNPGAMATWRGKLMAHLLRYQRYPSESRRRGDQGVPIVVFTMTRNGVVLSQQLQKSSGHDALDIEAIDLFRRASPLPPMPADVTGETFQYVMPINFNLH